MKMAMLSWKARVIMNIRWNLLLLATLIAVLMLASACDEAEDDVQEDILIWSGQIAGEHAYVRFDERAEELLLVTDSDVWRICLWLIQLDDVEIWRIAGQDSSYAMTGLPYLTYDNDMRTISVLRDLRGNMKLREFHDEGTTVHAVGDAGWVRFSEQVDSAQFFAPVMLVRQTYRFHSGTRWFELAIEVEQGDENTYNLELYRLAQMPDAPHLDAPGYLVEHHEEGYSVWVAEAFEDQFDDYSRWCREAMPQAREFLGLDAFTPVHLVVAPRDEKLPPRSPRSNMRYFPPYARATWVSNSNEDMFRRLVLTAVQYEAGKEREGLVTYGHGHLPAWLRDGLAGYFAQLGTEREETMSLLTHQMSVFVPLDNPRLLLDSYSFGIVMVEHLVDEFGWDVFADYVSVPREETATWETEEQLARERFGIGQEDILRAALENPPAIIAEHPPPDYVLTDWQCLTDAAGINHGFALSRDGSRIALIAAGQGSIRILDLRTGHIDEVFEGHHLEGFVALGTLSWFPCGERIAFMMVQAGSQDIYVLNLQDGSHEKAISSEYIDSGPDISPCGEHIAFRSERTGHSEIYIKDLITGEISQLTDEKAYLTWPVWSEDSTRLAITDRDRHRIGIMDLDTLEIRWVDLKPHAAVSASRPRWTNDDEVVLTVATYGVSQSLLSVNLSTGEQAIYGGLGLFAQWGEPSGLENQFYIRTSLWDPGREAIHFGIAKATFELDR